MLESLARHSFGAILLAVIIEELGIPLPIPSDVMIVFAGATTGLSLARLGMIYVALTLASAVGASVLYGVVRRGGRPLIDRFGHYVHLGPEQLTRAEAFLSRSGWGGIALGRATPGLRYVTVIACGLLKIPYPRFVTAHLAGSSVYIAAFLALGAIFGPEVIERIHLPASAIRLLWVLPLAFGLPLLAVWGSSRFGTRAVPSGRRMRSAALLGGLAGAISLAATISATTTVAELLTGPSHRFNVAYTFLGWLLVGETPNTHTTPLLLYAVLLLLMVGVSVAYYELVLPYLVPREASRLWQVLGLALLILGGFGFVFTTAALLRRDGLFDVWWQSSGPLLLGGTLCGVAVFALTAVYGRTLLMTVTPAFRS